MNFLEAAFEILSKAGQPLHFTEITRRALARKILDTRGQTPDATMGSRLYGDTKEPDSQFKRVGRGIFDLATPAPPTIAQEIRNINERAKQELHARLMKMAPDRFEALIGELMLALGFAEDSLEITQYGGDGGIDVRGIINAGHITQVNAAVQVKRWKQNVPAPVVQGVRGSLKVHEQGIVITTGGFSTGAIQEAQANGKMRISLVDGTRLLDLLVQHKIGVKDAAYTVYTLDDEWWVGVGGDVAAVPPTARSVEAAVPAATQSQQPVAPMQAQPPVAPVAVISHVGPYPLRIRAVAHGETLWAEIVDEKGQTRHNDTLYRSPSGAGKAATNWKSCNGWTLWHYHDEVKSKLAADSAAALVQCQR